MTARDDMNPATPEFDRLIAAWFEAEARVHEPPELLERTIAKRRKTRSRPAWQLPERWLPMELTMRRARFPRALGYLALLAVVALLATAALVIVGSQRRVPAPFGLAANGAVLFATSSGDIATVDTTTGVTTTIVAAAEADSAPTFSRDGTRIAFVRQVTGGDAVFVVDMSGDRLVRLTTEPLASTPGAIWSPDGSKVAFVSLGGLWIAKTDGSGSGWVDLGDVSNIVELAWRPPDGRELILVGLQEGKTRMFLVKPDGSGLKRISSIDGNDGAFQWVTPSPDGKRVAFGMFPEKQIHIVTIEPQLDQIVAPVGGVGLNFPRWSPDGTQIAVLQVPDAGPIRIGVMSAGDLAPHLTLTGPDFTGGVQFDWSPDGRSILANPWDTDQTWLLDSAGGQGTQNSWRARIPNFIAWQRLAR